MEQERFYDIPNKTLLFKEADFYFVKFSTVKSFELLVFLVQWFSIWNLFAYVLFINRHNKAHP